MPSKGFLIKNNPYATNKVDYDSQSESNVVAVQDELTDDMAARLAAFKFEEGIFDMEEFEKEIRTAPVILFLKECQDSDSDKTVYENDGFENEEKDEPSNPLRKRAHSFP